MPWMIVYGPCWSCHRMFTFSAERVPSLLVDGEREPLCRSCVERANVLRADKGLEPIVVLPGAYDEDEVD